MREETQTEYLQRHEIPQAELPPRISRGWRFAGEATSLAPTENVVTGIYSEAVDSNNDELADLNDFFDQGEQEDLELRDLLDEEYDWAEYEIAQMFIREENAYMANEAVIDWLRAREAVNDLFTGTHKGKIRVKRKRQDFNEVEGNHGWYGGKSVRDRDNRHQSTITDWGDDVFSGDDSINTTEISDPYYDTSDDDFDWNDNFDWGAFNAEADSGPATSVRSRVPVEERDTAGFRRVAQIMERNAPKRTQRVRVIR